MIQKGIQITDDQATFIKNTDLNLSKFVQRKLNEKMVMESDDTE